MAGKSNIKEVRGQKPQTQESTDISQTGAELK